MQNPFLTSWIKAYLSYLSLALIWPASVQSEGQLPINCVDSGYFQRKQITTSLFMIANLLFNPNISYCSNLSRVVWFSILPARTAMEVQTSSPCYRQHLNEQLNGPCNVETILSLSETRPLLVDLRRTGSLLSLQGPALEAFPGGLYEQMPVGKEPAGTCSFKWSDWTVPKHAPHQNHSRSWSYQKPHFFKL